MLSKFEDNSNRSTLALTSLTLRQVILSLDIIVLLLIVVLLVLV